MKMKYIFVSSKPTEPSLVRPLRETQYFIVKTKYSLLLFRRKVTETVVICILTFYYIPTKNTH